MKILTANIAFGLRAMDRLVPNAYAHFAIHGWGALTYHFVPSLRGRTNLPPASKREGYIQSRKNLEPTLALIQDTDPDILILNEVIFDLYRAEIESALYTRGFSSIAWGMGGHYPGARISTLIATKEQGAALPLALPQRPRMGGGAGMGGIRLTHRALSIIGLHLSLGVPNLWKRQVQVAINAALEEKRQGKEVILAGDWNENERAILQAERFESLDLISASRDEFPTCPTFLPWMMKPFDHIFIPASWKRRVAKAIPFGSDHLALLAEVETSIGE